MARLHVDSDEEFPDIDLVVFQLSNNAPPTNHRAVGSPVGSHGTPIKKSNQPQKGQLQWKIIEPRCFGSQPTDVDRLVGQPASLLPAKSIPSTKADEKNLMMIGCHCERRVAHSIERFSDASLDFPRLSGDIAEVNDQETILNNAGVENLRFGGIDVPIESSRQSSRFLEDDNENTSSRSMEADEYRGRRADTGHSPRFQDITASSPECDTKAVLIYSPRGSQSPAKISPELCPPNLSTRATTEPNIAKAPAKVRRQVRPLYRDGYWTQFGADEKNKQYFEANSEGRWERRKGRAAMVDMGHNILRTPSRQGASSLPNGSKAGCSSPLEIGEFQKEKYKRGEAFLMELDLKVTGGKVTRLAASTGGVHLIWSKRLNTTAGRANWRREIMETSPSSGDKKVEYRHHASIELAEKIVNNNNRLLNVIAHEYCHLANFMINGVRDNPHGKEFKEWARKCSDLFNDRGIEVTTKHSYDIKFKYIWQCQSCGLEFKRHSKSIDPQRHSCGSCKSRLVQTHPPPRKSGSTLYQLFVKENYKKIRDDHPHCTQREIMGLLGKAYKKTTITATTSKNDEHQRGNTSEEDINFLSQVLAASKLQDTKLI